MSSMNEDKLKVVVEEVVNNAVEPLKKQLDGVVSRLDGVVSRLDGVVSRLDDPDTGLKTINERLDANTAAVMKLESTINGYGDMYKINDSNVRKLEKRVEILEENADITPSPELTIAEV